MKNYFFIIFFLTMLSSVAQDVPRDYVALRDELKTLTTADDVNNMAGSPYINKDFLPGKIIVDEKQFQDVFLRFNALKDVMEIKVKLSDSEIFILPRMDKYTFQQDNKTFYLKDIVTEDGDVLSGFLINYFEDPKVLFVGKPITKMTASKAPETGYEKAKPAKVETYVHYYLSLNDEPVTKVKLREKEFRKIFKSEKMKKYFADNKVKEVEDVIEMLEFYSKQA